MAEQITYSQTNADENFSEDYFKKRLAYMWHLDDLRSSGLATPEKLKDYLAIDPLGETRDTEYAMGNLEAMLAEEGKELSKLTGKNLKSVLALADEKKLYALAFQLPTVSSGTPDEGYDRAKKAIGNLRETVEAIQKDKEGSYIKAELAKRGIDENSVYAKFLLRHKEGVFKADQRIMQARAIRAVKGKGVVNYLTALYSNSLVYKEKTDEERQADEALRGLAELVETATTSSEKVTALNKFNEEKDKFTKKYENSMNARGVLEVLSGKKVWSLFKEDKPSAEENDE